MAFNAGAIVAKLKLDSKEYTNGIKSAKKQARGLQTELKKNQAAVKKQTANWKAGGMAAGKLGIAAERLSLSRRVPRYATWKWRLTAWRSGRAQRQKTCLPVSETLPVHYHNKR
jgi:hypothetical protein